MAGPTITRGHLADVASPLADHATGCEPCSRQTLLPAARGVAYRLAGFCPVGRRMARTVAAVMGCQTAERVRALRWDDSAGTVLEGGERYGRGGRPTLWRVHFDSAPAETFDTVCESYLLRGDRV